MRVALAPRRGGDEGEAYLGTATFTQTDWAAVTPLTAEFTPAAPIAVNDSSIATAIDFDGNTSELPSLATVVPEPSAPLTGVAAGLAIAALSRRRARPAISSSRLSRA